MSAKIEFRRTVYSSFQRYFVFRGRASKTEFWYFFLSFVLTAISIEGAYLAAMYGGHFGVVGMVFDAIGPFLIILLSIVLLGSFPPLLSVSIRRLHDIGKSGWVLLIVLIPILGAVMLLFLFNVKGDAIENDYGHIPSNHLIEGE